MQQLCRAILFLITTWMFNVELLKDNTYEGGRVRLFVGNRRSGRANVSPGRVQEKWPVDNSASMIPNSIIL